jgi:predicted HicB family RNase H-like nuclease
MAQNDIVSMMMKYKGYIGVIKIDIDAGVLRGHVTNTRDTITFQGKSVPEAIAEFRVSVDEYLDFCKSLGQAPEKPFPGKFLVRINPDVHRDLTAVAQSKGVSVNRLVTRELARLARRSGPTELSKAKKPTKPSGPAKPAKPTKAAKATKATKANPKVADQAAKRPKAKSDG